MKVEAGIEEEEEREAVDFLSTELLEAFPSDELKLMEHESEAEE